MVKLVSYFILIGHNMVGSSFSHINATWTTVGVIYKSLTRSYSL